MVRGYCKYHKSLDIKDRLFEIDERDEIVECPVCHKRMKQVDATKAYSDKIRHFLYWGRFHLFVTTNYFKAYRNFASALELDPLNIDGYSGRILSLFMMSTLRASRFEDTKEMVIQAFSLLAKDRTKHDTIVLLLSFLDKFINKYLALCKKKLSHKVYFYDNECINLYLKRVTEALDLRKVIAKEVEQLINRHQKDDVSGFKNILEQIKQSIERDEHDLNTYQPCLDGYSYKPLFDKHGSMVLIDDGFKQKINLSSYHPFSINKEKGKYQIKDLVFTSYSRQYKFFLSSTLIIILSSIFAISSLVCAYIYTQYQLYLFIIAISLAANALIFIVVRIILYLIIRKRIRKSLY